MRRDANPFRRILLIGEPLEFLDPRVRHLRTAEDEFLEIAQRLKAMMARDKERDRRSLAADICDSCFAQLRRSIETQGMRR